MMVKKIAAILFGGLIAAICMAVLYYSAFNDTSNEVFFTFTEGLLLLSIFSIIWSIVFFISLAVIGLSRADNLFKLGVYSFLYQIVLFMAKPYIDFGAWSWLIIFSIGLVLTAFFYKAWQKSA